VLVAGVLDKSPRRAAASRPGVFWLFAEFVAAGLFAAMGVAEFVKGLDNQYVRCVYGALSILTAVAIVVVAAGLYGGKSAPSRYGLWATVPVFWGCFAMIMNFWGHAGDPVLSSYIYGTLAVVCASLSVFGTAGFCFRRGKHISTQFYTLTALMLAALTLGGSALARAMADGLHPSVVLSMPQTLLFGAIAAHMLAIGFGLAQGVYDFGIPGDDAPLPAEAAPDKPADVDMPGFPEAPEAAEPGDESRQAGDSEDDAREAGE